MAELSDTHHADSTDTQPQDVLLGHLKQWEAGSNTDQEGDNGGKPIIAVSTPAGKIDIQAHNGNIEITASEHLILTGVKGVIVNGQVLQVNTQGAGLDMGNGAITSKTTGTHTAHAAQHRVTGPADASFTPPNMPQSALQTDEKFVVQYRGSGKPVKQRGYTFKLDRGQTVSAKTDDQGKTDLLQSDVLRGANLKLERE